jgi:hypothetical protein
MDRSKHAKAYDYEGEAKKRAAGGRKKRVRTHAAGTHAAAARAAGATSAVRPEGVKKRKRRRLTRTAKLLIALIVAVSAGGAACVYFLKASGVESSGSSVYSQEQIVKASGLSAGDRLLLADRKAASAAVSAKLPYILSAHVTLRLPDVFVIEVKPDKASLCLKLAVGYAAVDRSGKVLELSTDNKKFASLPEVDGVVSAQLTPGAAAKGEAAAKISAAQKVADEFGRNKNTGIKSVDVTDLYQIKANYMGRIQIIIGTSSDIPLKVKFACTLISNKNNIKDTDKGVLDVSKAAQSNRANFIPS